ncbi:MAG: hypothetical protein ACYCXT_00940 [Acidiferrobacteraceae bacterium]
MSDESYAALQAHLLLHPVIPEQEAELDRRLDAYEIDQNPGSPRSGRDHGYPP